MKPIQLSASDPGTVSFGPRLVLSETDAVVTTPKALSQEVYAHFRDAGIPCSVVEGFDERDVIDFGDPSPEEESQIRRLFTA